MRSSAQRARRLVRWYPRRWRVRYGEEFEQLLIDDMAERPRSLHRTADVVRSGLSARLRAGGLAGDELVGVRQIRAGLAWLGAACAAGVRALARRVPASVTVVVTGGCHDTAFFASQTPASLGFLAAHIA